jgi:hypothetical protein
MAFTLGSTISFSQIAIQNKVGKWGFADNHGKIVIPFNYEYAFEFSEGKATVKLNGKWGYIDINEKLIIPMQYDAAEVFKEGLAAVCLNDSYGFIDSAGKIVIPLKYVDVENFNQGIAYVQIAGDKGDVGDRNTIDWIYIDKTGKKIQ